MLDVEILRGEALDDVVARDTEFLDDASQGEEGERRLFRRHVG